MIVFDKIRGTYYNLIKGIKNLIKWFPIVWMDRDWDYNYLMYIISYKLKLMSELHSKEGYTESSPKVAEDLRIASFLAEKIADENYIDEAFGDKKYLLEKRKFKLTPLKNGEYRLETTNITNEEREEISRLYDKTDELLERDIHILFDLMKRELRNWWD